MASDPIAATAAWLAGMQSAGTKVTAGVQGVTVAPGQAAARQVGAYVAGVAASQQKWAKNVAGVSLNDWQTAMTQKGIPRMASGASAAQGKMQNAMTQLLPQIDTIVNSLPPRGDINQNIQRAVTFMQKMSQVQINK